MSDRRVVVFGPAYLDRVLRVDRPLIDPAVGPPLDQSVDGACEFTEGPLLDLVDPSGHIIAVEPPAGWPGPTGKVRCDRPIREGLRGPRVVRGLSWRDDLGGMGAGYAAALKGRLYGALGPDADPISQAIERLLAHYGVEHHPVRVADAPADWTLLVTSGEFGDKLPIGFRGCHARLKYEDLQSIAARPCDLRVVAALPNHLASRLLFAPGARTRFFAPAMRNVLDRDCPLSRFAGAMDVLSCNRREWEALEGGEAVARHVSVLVVTDGPKGSTVWFTPPGEDAASARIHVPALPRDHPPRDTNRAGEAFAAVLVGTLLDEGWAASRRIVDEGLIRTAAGRASAAAALVLDRLDFGFPAASEIDDALRDGRVGRDGPPLK